MANASALKPQKAIGETSAPRNGAPVSKKIALAEVLATLNRASARANQVGLELHATKQSAGLTATASPVLVEERAPACRLKTLNAVIARPGLWASKHASMFAAVPAANLGKKRSKIVVCVSAILRASHRLTAILSATVTSREANALPLKKTASLTGKVATARRNLMTRPRKTQARAGVANSAWKRAAQVWTTLIAPTMGLAIWTRSFARAILVTEAKGASCWTAQAMTAIATARARASQEQTLAIHQSALTATKVGWGQTATRLAPTAVCRAQ